MSLPIFTAFRKFLFAGLMGAALVATAQAKPDPHGPPDQFVLTAANEALAVLKKDPNLKSGDLAAVNKAVDTYILPYVDFNKTTRLAAGRYWRQANADQQRRLADAFRGTLIRTYSGALSNVDANTTITMLPFRGDAQASDVVVSSTISRAAGNPVRADYRLEKTPQGWKIYDINVEDIWLIQNYRNQFAQEIQRSGIEGLIKSLNQRNQ